MKREFNINLNFYTKNKINDTVEFMQIPLMHHKMWFSRNKGKEIILIADSLVPVYLQQWMTSFLEAIYL